MAKGKGDVYKFDGDRPLRERFTRTPNGESVLHKAANHPSDEHDNTDTQQWCELHRGHCNDVVPVRRCFDNPNRQSIVFYACQNCIRDLKKAELIAESKYAGLPCVEIIVPRGLSNSYTYPRAQKQSAPSLLRSRQQSYEVTLDALQVKYLRALGLRVIPA